MQLNWRGKSYRPSQAIRVYEPDINELIKPLSQKATKGTIFLEAQAINPKRITTPPVPTPSQTPTLSSTPTPTPTPSATETSTPTPTPTLTPTPTSTPAEQFYLLYESGDVMEAENGDLIEYDPFSPTDIGGLELWLDSSTGVTLSGSSVTSWEDEKSGGNRIATPSNAAQFSLGDVLNGYTGVTNATGSTASMSISSATSSMSAWTVFIVHRLTAIVPSNYSYFLGEGGELSGLSAAYFNLTGPTIFKNPLFLQSGTTALNTNYYSTYQFSPTINQIRRNGALLISDGGASATWSFNRLFENTANGTRTFRGTIWEILIYNSRLDGTQINTVEKYLKDKYNL